MHRIDFVAVLFVFVTVKMMIMPAYDAENRNLHSSHTRTWHVSNPDIHREGSAAAAAAAACAFLSSTHTQGIPTDTVCICMHSTLYATYSYPVYGTGLYIHTQRLTVDICITRLLDQPTKHVITH